MRGTALPTDGRSRFVASDRTGRPWITLIVLRGVHQTGTGSMREVQRKLDAQTQAIAAGGQPEREPSALSDLKMWLERAERIRTVSVASRPH